MDAFTLEKVEFDAIRRILSEFCRTSLGKSLARKIGPSAKGEIVRRWLGQTTQMVEAVRDHGLPPFGGVTDISGPLDRAHPGGGASGEDFAAIASTLTGAEAVRAYLLALPETLPSLREVGGKIGSFQAELEGIRAVVASDGSIRDDASERLRQIRTRIADVTRQIHNSIHAYVRTPEVARLLQNPRVTLHADRYVLPVKAENRGRLPGVVHRASNTGATVFVEPIESVELNNRLADLNDDERAEIERLLDELAVHISGRTRDIASTCRLLAQVDLVAAKAQYAYQFEMTCPEMVDRGEVQLHQARHPLLIDQARRQELAGVAPEDRHRVVPIDVRLGSDFDVLVITGSNTGGKTVALKTLALLSLMAQSGMHIPVRRGAKLPVFRDVLLDVGDEQSLEQSLSTFGAHIRRVRQILAKTDGSCLVLLDELGSGTDPDEGGAIGQAVLDELREIGCLAMVTTHLSVLKAYAFTQNRVDNASVEFDTKTLSPTYHLRIGTPGESHAITVARHLGMPKRVMSRARTHLDDQNKQFRKAIQSTNVVRRSAERARREARQAELHATGSREAYESKLADLHRLQEEFLTWLAALSDMKPGEELYVPSMNRTGTLARLELHRQVALVDVDTLQIEVPLRELMPQLGQDAVRREIAEQRRQISEEARRSAEAGEEARKVREELDRELRQHHRRARQFDTWLSAISRLRVGQEVPIARKPGTGKVVSVDLPGLRATVETPDGMLELSIQDLFPQTGPFARAHPGEHPTGKGRGARKRGRGPKGPAAGKGRTSARRRAVREEKNRPLPRRSPDSPAARKSRKSLEKVQPGEEVYVVPFRKRATLIRLSPDKDNAVVQSGIFEMEVPLADLEPVPGA